MSANTANEVLITVSGVIPDDLESAVAAGRRPRVDYLELARRLHADLIDVAEARRASGRLGRLLERVGGPALVLAWVVWRRSGRYRLVLTDGEQVGLPLAALGWLRRRRPRHVMIVHIISTRSKSWMIRLLGLRRKIDELLVYCIAQREFAMHELHFASEAVTFTNFMTDTAFFDPDAHPSTPRRMLCTAGLECRDFPTMIEACRDLDVEVVIAAASPWSKRRSGIEQSDLPANVSVVRLDLAQLRTLYAESALVVVPLLDVAFQAGITTILEAMSMAKPVVCTRSAGQTDVIVDEENGVYVPPGDATRLRQAIVAVLDDAARAERLGREARKWAVEHADIAVYADTFAGVVDRHLATSAAGSR